MAGQVFEEIGSRNSCEINVFWSRISIPDEELYDPMVTTAIMRLLPNISETDQRTVRLPFASARKREVFEVTLQLQKGWIMFVLSSPSCSW